MSVKVEDSKPEPPLSLKQQCVKCFQGTNCINTVVILLCVMLVVQQISSCIDKLVDKPITTYTHFDYNKTITYPSVTFCREPPYKENKLEKYNLHSHPRSLSQWREFNFSRIRLDELWEEITYNQEDYFVSYGLDRLPENVIITPVMGFVGGRCYTVSPIVEDIKAKATRDYGYSITLQHYASDLEAPTSKRPPGYHVYIHYGREPYTEVEVYNGGLVDYLYINTGETVSVKLKVDKYVMISREHDPCSNAANYSANSCTTQYVTDLVAKRVGCSGPWMKSDLPYCNNFPDMRSLMSNYTHFVQNHECRSCPRFCHSLLYNAFVTDRQQNYTWDDQDIHRSVTATDASLETTIYLQFNNMMISVYEEKHNYDWNLFVSDLGGSVGFLLGLSVVGLFNIIGYIGVHFIRPFICSNSKKVTVTKNSNCDSVATNNQSEYFNRYDQRNVTFCREPPYKENKLEKYNLHSHPRSSSQWREFNFSRIRLDELWEEITYNQEDYFVSYGLDRLPENVIITPGMGFVGGRCYTVSPIVEDIKAKATRDYGYSITLQHYASDLEAPTSKRPPGYHVYIHYGREPYTEVEVYNGGLVDYLYINTGETVSVKLKVDKYVMISREHDPCSNAANYSANSCTTQYVTDLVAKRVGCSGPWMKSDLPYCNNFPDMRSLMSNYTHFVQNHECRSCPRFCHSLLYNAFVTDRQQNYTWDDQDIHRSVTATDASLETTIYLQFNNMMISVYEEKHNYDWNLFVSDLGGSIGFLLGLSVVGLFNIIGYIGVHFIRPFICSNSKKVTVTKNSNCDSVATNNQSEYFNRYDQRK